MGYQSERESFIARMASMGMDTHAARLILRHANTYQRLAVRECNGDDEALGLMRPCPMRAKQHSALPCDVCGKGEGKGMHERVTASSVRMTQIEARIAVLCKHAAVMLTVEFQGDPRGYCVRICQGKPLAVAGYGFGVPTREY